MKQRTARAWRQGQSNPVLEITLDAVHGAVTDSLDQTLDEVRGYYQKLEGSIFDAVIKDAQSKALDDEWLSMPVHQASLVGVEDEAERLAEHLAELPYRVDQKTLELVASPLPECSSPPRQRAA